MLRLTEEQGASLNGARAAFNSRQTALASASMFADGFGDTLTGNAAQIPLDAWRRIDQRAVQLQRDQLVVFNRLAAASSTPVTMGDLVNYFPKISDSGEVHVTMDGRSEGRADQALVKYEGTPVPIFNSQARFGWRQMEVMRKGPSGIDTATIANHQRKVAEKLEDVVLNGYGAINVAGSTIYGLRTFPQRATGVHGMDLNGATGAQWLGVVQGIVNAHLADNAFGRITIFLNYSDYVFADINEFTSGYPKTILARLREVSQVAEFVPVPRLVANEVISIANIGNGDWGTILSGMPMVTRPKIRHNPEDDYVLGVIASAVPQFRSDYEGRSQIAHYTKA